MEITAQEAGTITEKKITDDKRREKESREEHRQEAEKWAQKKFPGKINFILLQIEMAARRGETYTSLSLTVTNEELREVLLAKLVIKELQESRFSVFYTELTSSKRIKNVSDYTVGNKIQEYYASWGPKPTSVWGFKPIWVNDLVAVK